MEDGQHTVKLRLEEKEGEGTKEIQRDNQVTTHVVPQKFTKPLKLIHQTNINISTKKKVGHRSLMYSTQLADEYPKTFICTLLQSRGK